MNELTVYNATKSRADDLAKTIQEATYDLAKMAWKSDVLRGCLVHGSLYKHRLIFEGALNAGNASSDGTMVVYKHNDTGVVYVRPYVEFYAQVEHEGRTVPRFRLMAWDEPVQ